MSVVVAEGVVKVTADSKAVGDDLERSIKGASGKAESSGRGFGSKLLGGVGKVFAGGALAVGGVLAAGIGTSLVKGFSRLGAIDQANAKLVGLGNSAKSVDAIMGDALASVKGTAFGLDSAATVAASAVAAGIKPGQDLQKTLKLTADAATIAGTDMESMGSIFNKVASSNKLQGDTIAQLQDQGIPVLQFVAKQMGVTAEEASKMASEGKVSFADFSAAMQAGLGGAALSSGNTFSGAVANFNASLGRIGAGLLGGIFPTLAPAITSITKAMAPLEAAASGVGAAIGSVVGPAIENFANGIGGIGGKIGPVFSSFMEFIGPIADAFAPLVTLGLQLWQALSPVSLVFSALQQAGDPLLGFLQSMGTAIGNTLVTAVSAILPVFQQLAGVLSGALATVIPMLLPLVMQLVNVFLQLAPVVGSILAAIMPLVSSLITMLVPIIMQLVGAVLPPLIAIFQMIVPAIMPLVNAILGLLIPAIQLLMPIIQTVFAAIVPIITAAMQIIQGVIQVVTGIITGNWSQVWSGIKNIVSGVWNAIKAIVTGALSILGAVISGGLNAAKAVFSAVWNAIKAVVSAVINGIIAQARAQFNLLRSIVTTVSNAVRTAISAGFNAARAIAAAAINGIVSAARSMVSGVSSAVNSVVNFFRSLGSKITGAVSGFGSLLVSVGRNVIQGFINGAKSMAGSILSAVTAPIKGAIDGAKSLLGIHSPSRVFRQIGVYVGQGLEGGLKASTSRVHKASKSMVNAVLNAFDAKKITAGQRVGLVNAAQAYDTRLSRLAANRAKVATKLSAASKNLATIQKNQAKYEASVLSSLQKFDITKVATGVGGSNIISALRAELADTKAFTKTITALRKAGLDNTSLQQFISAGVDSLPQAKELLAGGKSSIKQVASLQKQLGSATKSFAATSAKELYSAGVQSARGIVAGLKSQQAAIEKQMRTIAAGMTRAIKKTLGIHSPSRVFRDEVGSMLGKGVAVGFSMEKNGIVRAVRGTIADAMPSSNAMRAQGVSAVQPASIDSSRKIEKVIIQEARDPLGTVGRLSYAWETMGRTA